MMLLFDRRIRCCGGLMLSSILYYDTGTHKTSIAGNCRWALKVIDIEEMKAKPESTCNMLLQSIPYLKALS
jgi:hypothetical protein